MDHDTVSVVMPTYNRAHLIGSAINSILEQTHKNLILYIYDDGSDDDTEGVVRSFTDDRIVYIKSLDNKGVSYARNYLMDIINTELAIFHDSDDLSNVHRIAHQIEVMKSRPDLHMCASRRKWFAKESDVDIYEEPKVIQEKMVIGSMMFRTEGACRFELNRSIGGEDVWWRRNMQKKFGECMIIKKVMYYMREHPDRIGYWRKGRNAPRGWARRMKSYARNSIDTNV